MTIRHTMLIWPSDVPGLYRPFIRPLWAIHLIINTGGDQGYFNLDDILPIPTVWHRSPGFLVSWDQLHE